ncbi:MAG: hypothetical protein WCP21_07195 [Armatimonadota bacterium]
MFGRTTTHLIVAIAVVAMTAGMVSVTPACADGKTNRLLAGLAIGAIIGAAISSGHDDGPSRCYGTPYTRPPVYDPYPRHNPPSGYGYVPPPRQVYNAGYRDGYSDGTQNGRRQGYNSGFNNGYHVGYGNGRQDQYYAGAYGYRPPPPVAYRPPTGYRPLPGPCW